MSAAGAAAKRQAQAQALIEQGRQQLRQGAPQAALALLGRALSLAPDHVDASHLSGLALIALGHMQAAVAQLQHAAQLAPQWVPEMAAVHSNLGRARLLAGSPANALQSFEHALRCDPGHLQAGMQRAGVLESLGQAEAAAAGFLTVAQAHPQHLLAHLGAAQQLYRLGRIEQAVASQMRAAALSPQVLLEGRIGGARCRATLDATARRARAAEVVGQCHVAPGVDGLAAAQAREIVIVDNFLPDPLATRGAVLAMPFPHSSAQRTVNYPGRQTEGGFADTALLQRMADLLGHDLKWAWPGHGAYRLSPAGSLARSDIHADHDDARPAYAGVLYLSLPQHCQGGTSFWRHRDSGWAKVPSPAEATASAYGSYDNFLRAQSKRHGPAQAGAFDVVSQDRAAWTLELELPMHFNRLVLYRSDYFHAISQVFGQDPEDSRLVQLFFFERWENSGRA
jgi:tetratricopeptide (TPR) repeat protein